MTPIEFPQANITLAKNQPEYRPLPVYADINRGEVTSCWSLSWKERLTLLITGKLWLLQMTFNQRLQPQLPLAESPFGE